MTEFVAETAVLWIVSAVVAFIIGYLMARPISARKTAADQRRRIEQLAALNQVGHALSSALRLNDLLEKIYQEVSRLIDATHYYVALYDPETDTISFPLAKDHGRPWQIASRKAGNALAEYVIRTRQPLLIPCNPSQKSRELGLEPIGEPTRSWLGVPMISGDQLLGIIAVQNTEREDVYNQEHLELLQTIAAQAAVAVANARLYERTDQALARRVDELASRNHQLHELLRLGNVLKSSFQLQDLLERVVQAVVDALGFNLALLSLVEPGPPPHMRRVASAGIPLDIWKQMQATTVPLEEYRSLMRPEFCISRSYFISDQHSEAWEQFSSFYTPDLGPRTEGEWRAEDALLVPLTGSEGQLIGILSVDDPDDRRIPTLETIEVLEVFANQAAVAIESARLFQRLADGHDRLRAILDSTRDGMIMVDTSGRIVVANNTIRDLFGISPDQLIHRRLAETMMEIPERTLTQMALFETIYHALNELAERSRQIGKGEVQLSEPHRTIDLVSAPVMDAAGVAIGRLLVLHDVTEERDAEALRQDLTRMMVHDLRSPLTNILGSLELLEDTMARSPKDKHILELARLGGMRLLTLINSLLDINRLEVGQMPLDQRPVSWHWLVQTAQERVSTSASKAGVTISTAVPDDLPQVEADAEVILRVLVNLLDNAIQYSPRGTNVNVLVALTADRQAAECRVCDKGPGIPSDYRERIFDKFVQAPGPRRQSGTGLGLAFSRLAVEAHGGRIWVEDLNMNGSGSAFVFTLPIVKRDT